MNCCGNSQLCIMFQACEAVVLVFDATSEASLAEVQRWAAASALQAAEIRLMVANKVDRLMKGPHADGSIEGSPTALKRSSRLAAAQAWCSEHLYEYIEVSGLVILLFKRSTAKPASPPASLQDNLGQLDNILVNKFMPFE